jgi:hypothetical protein
MEGASRLDPFPVRVWRQWLYIHDLPAERVTDRNEESRQMLTVYMRTWRVKHNHFSLGSFFPFGGMNPGYRGGGYPGMVM